MIVLSHRFVRQTTTTVNKLTKHIRHKATPNILYAQITSHITKMAGPVQGNTATTKAGDTKNGEQQLSQDKKPATQLEEDDEFEDFPVEGACAQAVPRDELREGQD